MAPASGSALSQGKGSLPRFGSELQSAQCLGLKSFAVRSLTQWNTTGTGCGGEGLLYREKTNA